MRVMLPLTVATLNQIRLEIDQLKALPTAMQCPTALQALEQLESEISIDLEDEAMGLTKFVSPSHSWLRVPIKEIQRLKLEGRLSRFSYRGDTDYYLETDTDMTKFLDARDAEGRPVSDWDKKLVLRFPHAPDVKRLDDLPGYCSMA